MSATATFEGSMMGRTGAEAAPHAVLERIRPHFTFRPSPDPSPRVSGMRETQSHAAAGKFLALVEAAGAAGVELHMLDAVLAGELARVVEQFGGMSVLGLALHESHSFMGLASPGAIAGWSNLGFAASRVEQAEAALDRLSSALPEPMRRAGILPPGKLAAWLDARRREALDRVREELEAGYAEVAASEVRDATIIGVGLRRRVELWRSVAEAAVLVAVAWPEGFLDSWSAAPVVALSQFGVGQVEPFIPSIFG